MYSSREEAAPEKRLARERSSIVSILAAQLTADIRRAGVVASPSKASQSKTYPNPTSTLPNQTIEKDCGKPTLNPANHQVDPPKPCRMCTYITNSVNPFRM